MITSWLWLRNSFVPCKQSWHLGSILFMTNFQLPFGRLNVTVEGSHSLHPDIIIEIMWSTLMIEQYSKGIF